MKRSLKYLLHVAFALIATGWHSWEILAASAPSCLRQLTVDDGLSQNMVYCIFQDSQGYMWFGTQDGLNRFDGNEFKVYKKNAGSSKSVASKGFFSMLEAEDGNIWIATSDGINIYNPTLNEFRVFSECTFGGDRVAGNVRGMQRDDDGNIWIGCQDGKVFCWDPYRRLRSYDLAALLGLSAPVNIRSLALSEDGSTVYVATYGNGVITLDDDGKIVRGHLFSDKVSNDVNTLCPFGENSLLVGTSSRGVQLFDRTTGTFSSFLEKDFSGQYLFVRSLLYCSDRMLWIGTETGLYIYNLRTGKLTNMEHSTGDPYSLSDNAVHSIYEDRDEGIWVGTYFGGVNYISKYSVFEKYYPIPGQNSIGGRCISEFAKDPYGYLWVATEDAGLFRFKPSEGRFHPVRLDAKNIHALMCDGNDMWVGSFTKGLYLLDARTSAIKKRWTRSLGNIGNDNIYSIYKDSYGRVWAGTMAGLSYYESRTGNFVPVLAEHLVTQVNDMIEDSNGLIWVASYGNGIWTYDSPYDKWTHYSSVIKSGVKVDSHINCLVADYDGRIWVGTDGDGVCLYDEDSDDFEVKFDSHNGLLNDVVYSLKCDRRGNIWGTTNKGLFCINLRTMNVTTYTHESGLICDQFNYKSGFSDSDGTMYFGSIEGFVSFNPDRIPSGKSRSQVLLSSLEVNNEEVHVGDKNVQLSQSIFYTKELRIPHDISAFSLGVHEINYAPSHNSTYYYKMEGWDKVWLTAEMPCKITYSNLPSGCYRFRVRSSMDSEIADSVSLEVIKLPPLWRTWWAYLIYILLISGIIWIVVLILNRRMEEAKEKEEKALLEEKEKEIFRAKIEFFSNITHEIRTPLSLIRMPLEEIIAKTPKNNPQHKNLLIIRDNVDRLLTLVNQLLDFRKINGGKEAVQFIHADAVHVIMNTVARFRPVAQLKNIRLENSMPEILPIDVDVEMLTKMTSNLLSNAIKHAAGVIQVEASSENGMFVLSVINDGNRIPFEMQEKIFNPFYKLDETSEGFGIGLPFVRSLADLHNGSIALVQREDKRTEFRIVLPLEQENTIRIVPRSAAVSPDSSEDDTLNDVETYKKTLLLVDNDSYFVDFMSKQLSGKYKIIKAYTAEKAMEYLRSVYVDVVISDVKLSDGSGVELCEEIKSDKRYMNTPVILLTSDASRESKLAGIVAGADVYIEKPCYMDYLISCIENQFKHRYITEAAKAVGDEDSSANIVYTKADEEFINQLTAMIYDHIEEIDLDVNKLAELMLISRATLYRKVKESLRITPNDFIRIMRLKKAAELLRQKEYRINEIAYIVGFSSSSYFSKCFKAQYGVLPKDYI